MARSLQSVKLVLDGASTAVARRCFTAVSAQPGGAASYSVRTSAAVKRAGEEKVRPIEKVPWGPDPKTGYYRPEGGVPEIDVAKLRAALLKHSH